MWEKTKNKKDMLRKNGTVLQSRIRRFGTTPGCDKDEQTNGWTDRRTSNHSIYRSVHICDALQLACVAR